MGEKYADENLFLRDAEALRAESRQVIQAGNAAPEDPALAVALLQNLLAAEIICVMRYSLLAVSEEGLRNDWLATELQAQADDERRHMTMLARRIEALGGEPDFRPAGTRARIAAFSRCDRGLAAWLQQNLAAEQFMVEHYRELLEYFDRADPETAAICRDILQDEEEHRSDMQDLLVSSFN